MRMRTGVREVRGVCACGGGRGALQDTGSTLWQAIAHDFEAM